MIRGGGIAWSGALFVALLAFDTAAPALPINVQASFVGCRSDGEAGPAPAPATGPEPVFHISHYAHSSAYGTHGLAVLAPSGWHCVALRGPTVTRVIVTPERHAPADFLGGRGLLTGPAVEISRVHGAGGGRDQVAAAVSRYFSAPYAPRPSSSIWRPSSRRDSIDRRGAAEMVFATPARRRGLGTRWPLAPGRRPIGGALFLVGEQNPDLVTIRVRLPEELDDFTFIMLAQSVELVREARPAVPSPSS